MTGINSDILCFTTLTEQHYVLARLIARCRVLAEKRIGIVVGGPHATLASESCARTLDADVVFRGPGEKFLQDLVLSLAKELDRSQVFRDECRIVTAPLVNSSDLAFLEFYPDRRCVDLNEYQYPFTIMTARGCPGRCTFCSSPAINNGLVHIRSIESIASEIAILKSEFIARRIAILDDSFTQASGRLEALCSFLGENNLNWFCESRLDCVDRNKLKMMREAGCSEIQFGVECFEQETLDRIGKNIRSGDISRVLGDAVDLGIRVAVSLMIGLPGDTVDSVRKRIARAVDLADLGVGVIEFGFLRPFPGTAIYHRSGEFGYGNVSNWWEQENEYPLCFPSSSMTRSELIGMMMYAVHKVREALGTGGGSDERAAMPAEVVR
jgi:radical SAM superfamily enzyme YgiQ (UPF0313 family)